MARRRQRFLTLITVLVMLGACAPGATRPPVPLALTQAPQAPTVTASALPVPASTLAASVSAVPVASLPVSITLDAIALTLPAGWAASLDPAGIRTQLTISDGTPQLIAWSQGANFQQAGLRLSVVQTPRQGLTLQRYVTGVAAGLAEQDGVSLERAAMTVGLRRDGRPAGEIQYRVAGPAGETRGYQVVLLDEAGEQLVLLNFASAPNQAGSAASVFDAIVRTIEPLP